jgi:hypothetical protein
MRVRSSLIAIVGLTLSASAMAGGEKVDVCHWTPEDGTYNLINVPTNSAHLTKHSDDFLYPGADAVPVYRVYNSGNGDHLYTVSSSEASALIGAGWLDEGILGYAYDVDGADLSPVYRLYNGVDHLYTMDDGEVTFALANGYSSEGIGFYAFDFDGGALADVYRVYRGGVDHLYTMSESEKDGLVGGGDVDEGILGYMFPTAVSCN